MKLTEEEGAIRNQKIIQLYNDGVTLKKIGLLVGISESRVYYIVRELGIHRELSREEKIERNLEVIRLYNEEKASCYEIAKIMNVTPRTILNIMENLGISRREMTDAKKRYDINEKFFDTFNEDSAFFIGLFSADGCITAWQNCISITLHIQDRYLLEELNRRIGSNRPIANKAKTNCCVLVITNKRIMKRFHEIGLGNKKFNRLHIPNEIANDRELFIHFLRGLIDGDGSIAIHQKSLRVRLHGCGSFLKEINILMQKYLGYKFSEYAPEGYNCDYLILSAAGSRSMCDFCDILYKNATIFLVRKYNNYIKAKKMREEGLAKNNIYLINKDDEIVEIFDNAPDAAKKLGLSRGTISGVLINRNKNRKLTKLNCKLIRSINYEKIC